MPSTRQRGGLTVALLLACSPAALPESGYKRYGLESGIIEYEVSGTKTGKETLYFDRWGAREAKYSTTRAQSHGVSRTSHRLALIEGEWLTRIDLDAGQGVRTRNTALARTANKMGSRDLSGAAERYILEAGGEKIGSEVIAGRACDVWELKKLGTKTWLWKSIPLKTHFRVHGRERLVVAKRVEDGVEIPEQRFVVPEGVELVTREPATPAS